MKYQGAERITEAKALADMLFSAGDSRYEVEDSLRSWNRQNCVPPIERHELEAIVYVAQQEDIRAHAIPKKEVEPKGTFEGSVDQILSELRKVMIKKQMDYGPRNILDAGQMGVLVRMNDKIARLKNLFGFNTDWKERESQNEAIEDSFIDIANYAIIFLMLRKGTFDKPLEREGIKGEPSQTVLPPTG